MLDQCSKPTTIVLAKIKAGKTTTEIREELKGVLAPRQVYNALKSLRRKGLGTAYRRRRAIGGNNTVHVHLSDEVRDKLRPHAEARNITLASLCGHILDASIDCVDAILDDRA